LSDSPPRLRAQIHPHVISAQLTILDTWSGVEVRDGRVAAALPPLLKGKPLDVIIDQIGSTHTLDILYELDELRRRGLLEADEQGKDDGEPAIVVTADYLDPQLEALNRDALNTKRPWMLARPRGTVVWMGPVFVPGRGPCWSCMSERLRAVRAAWQLPARRPDEDAPMTQIGLDLAALEAARWRREPESAARLLTFDTQTLEQRSHVIVRRSDCRACGDSSGRRAFTPVILQSRAKTFSFDGGHRAVPAEATYARYEHLISPLTGIVHGVERAYGDAGPLNVFVARHNFRAASEPIPRRSFGKGMTAAQARTGALCEALERYCGAFRGDESLTRARFPDLGDDAIHPNAFLGISERQYEERAEWNREAPRILWIPERFDEEQETDWAPAWSLTHQRQRFVAAALCYYGYQSGGNDFAHADSNGNAAGTCVEDAILQGLLELIERDAAGLWWYGRIKRPAVFLQTPYVEAMTREYAARGRRLWLLDLTTDIGIPVCVAVSAGNDPENLQLGFGAHPDPAIAVTRAITEANQLLAFHQRRRVYRGDSAGWTFLEPHGRRELTTSVPSSDDLRKDVLACVELLGRLGLEVLVLDQTRPEVGLPVVKVIVPGLRHFRPRFGPGRLYDVPLQLGWVEHRMREEELNPSHITA
jgi:oxazoline/thiazoline synthase